MFAQWCELCNTRLCHRSCQPGLLQESISAHVSKCVARSAVCLRLCGNCARQSSWRMTQSSALASSASTRRCACAGPHTSGDSCTAHSCSDCVAHVSEVKPGVRAQAAVRDCLPSGGCSGMAGTRMLRFTAYAALQTLNHWFGFLFDISALLQCELGHICPLIYDHSCCQRSKSRAMGCAWGFQHECVLLKISGQTTKWHGQCDD